MIGKFLPRKRHDLLLDALTQLAPTYNVSLTLIGEVSETTVQSVFNATTERAHDLPFPVEIKTNLPFREVQAAYPNFDLFVLPSEAEPASVSNLEAMSFGVPTVVSSCNGTASYNASAGWVFESGSLNDLVQVLRAALSDRDGLKNRGALSQKMAEQKFNPSIVYGDFFRAS